MLLHVRNQHNIVKQLSSNLKKILISLLLTLGSFLDLEAGKHRVCRPSGCSPTPPSLRGKIMEWEPPTRRRRASELYPWVFCLKGFKLDDDSRLSLYENPEVGVRWIQIVFSLFFNHVAHLPALTFAQCWQHTRTILCFSPLFSVPQGDQQFRSSHRLLCCLDSSGSHGKH